MHHQYPHSFPLRLPSFAKDISTQLERMAALLPCRSCLQRLGQTPFSRRHNVTGSYLPMGAALALHHALQLRSMTTQQTSPMPKKKTSSPTPSKMNPKARPALTPSPSKPSSQARSPPITTPKPTKTLHPAPLASPPPSSLDQIDLSSTLPARLDLPTAPSPPVALKQRITYLYSLGKASLAFYKTGFKNIYANYQLLRRLRPHLRSLTGTSNPSPAQVLALGLPKTNSDPPVLPELPRSLLALSQRTTHDLYKLPIMGLILLICGEFTPLVLLALGEPVTPYTCRMPSQRTKAARNLVRRVEVVEQDLSRRGGRPSGGEEVGGGGKGDGHDDRQRALAFVHGFDVAGWSVRRVPVLGDMVWLGWGRGGLRRWCEAVVADAWALSNAEGGSDSVIEGMTRDEVLRFAADAGLLGTMQAVVHNADTAAEQKRKGEGVYGEGLSEEEVQRAREGVGAFVDEVGELVGRERERVASEGGNVDAVWVFVEAARRVREKGLAGPWVPMDN